MAIRHRLRHGDQAIDVRECIAMLGPLPLVGQQVGQMLGTDHPTADGVGGARAGMPFPPDTGMDVNQIGAGAGEPAVQPGRIAGIDDLYRQPRRPRTIEQAAMHRRADNDVVTIDQTAREGQHMFAHARWFRAFGDEEQPFTRGHATGTACIRRGASRR